MNKNSFNSLTNLELAAVGPNSYDPVPTSAEPAPAIQVEIQHYLLRKKSKGLAPGTIQQYSIVLKALSNFLTTPLYNVTDWDILSFLDHYETTRHISKKRKENMRIILNGFFRYETDIGNVNRNPMVTIDAIKYRKTTRVPLSDIELELLRNACRTLRDKALFEFFFATGCRVSEVVALNRQDINTTSRSVKVLGKGDKERFVFLNAAAIVSLNTYLKSRTDDSPALFCTERRPYNRLQKSSMERAIRRLGERAGLERHVYPHLIRHTTATYLLNHGMNLEEVQMILGHESVDTTRIYAKTDTTLLMNSYKRSMI